MPFHSGQGYHLRDFHMHLVSDATGETVIASARACVAQFDGVRPIEHFWNLVRTQRQLNLALEGISEKPGIVIYTLVDRELRASLESTDPEGPVGLSGFGKQGAARAPAYDERGVFQPSGRHGLCHVAG